MFLLIAAFPGSSQPPPSSYVPAPPHPAAAYAGKVWWYTYCKFIVLPVVATTVEKRVRRYTLG